jgi:phosphoglycolate phosphatase-like HAD superfamily hydrolase
VVLTYGSPGQPALVRVQRVALLERLMVRSGGVHRRRWDTAVQAFVRHGTGYAVVEPLDDVAAGSENTAPDPASLALLAQHVGQGRARALVVGDDERATAPAFEAALAARGVQSNGMLAVPNGG